MANGAPLAGLLMVGLAGGCVGSFSTPSAYQDQVYLCDPDHATQFQALANSCQGGQSCAGVLSLTGMLQEKPLTIGTTLTSGQYFLVQQPGSSVQLWDEAKLSGASPYFDFIFHLKSIGGTVGQNPGPARTLVINGVAPSLKNALDDDQVQAGQLLEVSNVSDDLPGLTNSGTVVVTSISMWELKGTFHGQFGGAIDVVDGCFDMFPTQIEVNPTPTQ
jgi:hypothetical protein